MATKIGSLFGDVTLRTANLDKSIKSVGKKMKKMGADFEKLGKSLTLKLTAPIVGFGALSVKAFAEQEKAEAKLREAINQSGQAVDSNMAKLKRMASEIQKVTTVGDEMSLSMAQQAISMGLQSDKVGEAVQGAIGLSKAFDLDLKMAIRASTSALQGQTEILTRYIPELKNIEDPAERVALVQQKMAEGFNIATAEAQTTGGQLAQIKNAFGDLQEQIGEILAEYLTPLVDKLSELVKRAQEADPAMLELGVKIAGVSAAIGPLLLVLGPLVKLLASAKFWIVGIGIGLGLGIDKMGILQEVGETLGQMLYDIWTGDVVGAIGSFIALLAEVVELFTGPLGLTFSAERVRSDVVETFDAITSAVKTAVGWVKELVGWFEKLGNAITLGAAGKFGEDLGNFIGNAVFRAKGGPLSAGQPAIVGEQGPELFVPGQSGMVVPNHALGGSSGTNITMNFAPGIGMDVVTALKNSRGLIAQMAVDAVQENNLRRV